MIQLIRVNFLIFFLLVISTVAAQARAVDASLIDVEVLSGRHSAFEQFPVVQRGGTYRAYVEAERGRPYSIAIKNRTGQRIGVVVAVDGRNILSGARSSLAANERMYILGPYERGVYSGWRTGRDKINEFYFTDADQSYSAAWGDYSAMGVIAVAAFAERLRETYREEYSGHHNDGEKGARSQGKSDAGTGYGDSRWSASRQVAFESKRRPFARHFLKYMWTKTLCEEGIIDCGRKPTTHNRFWPEGPANPGFTPPPPRRW